MLNRVPEERIGNTLRCGNCKNVIEVPTRPVQTKAENFDRDVAYWPETLLVMFWAHSCLYCKIYDPLMQELMTKHPGRLKVLKIDAESEPYLAQKHTVTRTPTFMVYKNGVFAVRMDGAPKDKSEFLSWITNMLNYTSY